MPAEKEADDLRLSDGQVVDQQAVRLAVGLVGGEGPNRLIEAGVHVPCEETRWPTSLQEFLECERGVRHRVPR